MFYRTAGLVKVDILSDLIPLKQTNKFCHMIHNLTNYSSGKIILGPAWVCKLLDSSAEKNNISGVVFKVLHVQQVAKQSAYEDFFKRKFLI